MSVSLRFRFPRIEAMLGVCLLAFASDSNANEAPVLTTTAAVPIKHALQSAWRNHPNSRITEALLTATRAYGLPGSTKSTLGGYPCLDNG